ncbi:putative metal-dependent phosphoesterase TrpH [Labrenzia sp. EL_13]|nr:putative metal-dependent phosphoesterase TrpH [Labrenzia sp. EL_13]
MNRYLNVVLHAHSDWSYDGHWTLRQIARFFARRGVDVVMMSEHDTGFEPARFEEYRAECAEASNDRCTLIPGIEYSSPDNDIHILTWGLDHFLAEHRPVLETLRRVKAVGGVAIFAHPVRRQSFTKFDDAFVPYLDGIEVWNRKSDGVAPGQEAKSLIARTGLPASVGVDFHQLRHYWPLTHRFEIKEQNTESELVGAIKDRKFQPMVAGRFIEDSNGIVSTPVSDSLEALRRQLKRLRFGSWKRKS